MDLDVDDAIDNGIRWLLAHPEAAMPGYQTDLWMEAVLEADHRGEFNMADPCGCAVGVSAGNYAEFITVEVQRIDEGWELHWNGLAQRWRPNAMHAAESATRDVAIEHGFLWADGRDDLGAHALGQRWIERARKA